MVLPLLLPALLVGAAIQGSMGATRWAASGVVTGLIIDQRFRIAKLQKEKDLQLTEAEWNIVSIDEDKVPPSMRAFAGRYLFTEVETRTFYAKMVLASSEGDPDMLKDLAEMQALSVKRASEKGMRERMTG